MGQVKVLLRENRVLRSVVGFLTIISFTFTIIVGGFLLANIDEVNRILQVWLLIKTQYIQKVDTNLLMEGAVRGMVDSLNDPYSVFMNAQEFTDIQRYIQGSIGGIGIYVGIKDNNIVVVAPIEGTPAFKAGIQRDDVIVKINEKNTSEMKYDEAVSMMRGEPGTQVKVSIMRQGVSNLMEFNITREVIDIPTVTGKMLEGSNNMGYLRLRMFASNTDEAVTQQLKELQAKGMKGLILDLRDNPGGDLDSAVNIARHFVPKGPIVYTVDRGGDVKIHGSSEGNNLKIPLIVLINGGSASASEVLSGAIKDTKAGILLGEKTFGKGIVQAIFPIRLTEGDGLKLTTSKYLTPNKIDIHDKGIEPDIAVKPAENEKDDIQLQKATELLKEKLK